MLSDKRMTTALAAIVGSLLALLLVVEMTGSNGLWGQAAPAGPGGATIALVIGPAAANVDQPIYVLDSRNETFCIYAYNGNTHKFGLKAARTYKYDKQIIEFNNEAPKVGDVKTGHVGGGK